MKADLSLDCTLIGNQLRFLGLDVGDRRIGVAISDFTGSLATPMEVYTRREMSKDVEHVRGLVTEYDASRIVIGLPKHMNGTEGAQAEKTRQFADALGRAGVRVELWDERLSTLEATRRLLEVGRKRKSLRQRVDSEAAAVILETYLEYVRREAR